MYVRIYIRTYVHTCIRTYYIIYIGMGIGSAPGPPMPLRNIVPQERSTFDKVGVYNVTPATLLFNLILQFLDYVVGDGPGQRYALICSTCYAHNGMALKDEFEYISEGFVYQPILTNWVIHSIPMCLLLPYQPSPQETTVGTQTNENTKHGTVGE